MKLIIFDLDQTLVDFIAVHDRAVSELFKEVFGVEARLTEIDFAGRSLTESFIELSRRHGVPLGSAREKGREILARYERIFARSLPRDASGYILPGARQLLDGLSRTDNLVVLYTGDSPGIVKVVLESTGLGRYFAFFLSGTEVETRSDMVRQAIAEARKMTGRRFRGKDIVIIGDSVRDIDCGKEFNALTIAVATGFHSREELEKRAPDYLFNDLTDKRITQAIG
jgi:phosphoglycolate phosphatase